jgi:hypothetical protein
VLLIDFFGRKNQLRQHRHDIYLLFVIFTPLKIYYMQGVQALVIASQAPMEDIMDIPPNSDDGDITVTPAQRTCIRNDGDAYYHVKFMYLSAIFYFLAIGLSSISLIFLINDRIAGDASEPNSKSIFVQTTVVFLNNASSFLCLRYNSGFGDYIGRKPVVGFSALALIVTRLMYSRATMPAHFFVIAIFSGATESFYFSTLAWVCDVFPNHAERSKYYGIFAGIAGFAGVVVGAPLGAAISISMSPTAPFLISTLFSFSSFVVTAINPCCDTLSLQSIATSDIRMVTHSRAIPKNMFHFLCTHFPISKSSIQICLDSKKSLDWITFGVAQWTWSVLVLILVQYLLKVFDWSRIVSSLCLLTMGLSLGLIVPCLQNHYEPISLSFYSLAVQVVGYSFLSISGTGVEHYEAFGIVGLTLVALGLSWLPGSQSIIMSGYDFGKQG